MYSILQFVIEQTITYIMKGVVVNMAQEGEERNRGREEYDKNINEYENNIESNILEGYQKRLDSSIIEYPAED